MVGRRLHPVLLTVLFLVLFAQSLYCGIWGKIAGVVVDKNTGEPLVGANVILVGTQMGAATDLSGRYTILNIPPGSYSVKAIYMGYSQLVIKDVRVRIDQTSNVNFNLDEQVVEGEAVTIVAEKTVVKKDVSTSVASVSGDIVKEMPMTTVNEVVGLQAGVEDGMSIRGGAADEVLFQVDGVTLRDPRNNQPITGIPLSSIQEISIERGGFNAEYGQVRSGIVNIVTKEGNRKEYSASMTMQYAPATKKYFGISPYDAQSPMLRPYLDDAVCWNGTDSWDEYMRRQYPVFEGWNAVSRRLLADDDPTNDLSPAAAQQLFRWQHRRQAPTDQPDYNIDAGFGGPVPVIGEKLGNLRFFASYKRDREMLLVPLSRDDNANYDWALKVNSDITSAIRLTVSGMAGKSYHVAQNEGGLASNANYIISPSQVSSAVANYNFPRATGSRLYCDSYFSAAELSYKTFSAKLTHMLSPATFYEVSVEHLERNYLTEPIGLRDTSRTYEIVPGYFSTEAPFGFSPIHEPGVEGMMTGGHTSTARDYSRISTTKFKGDITSQADYYNLVKAGFEFVYSDLDFDYGDVRQMYPLMDVYLNMNKFPLRGALYVQDKLELEGLIVNAGLRLDYSDANTFWPRVDEFNKDFYSSNYSEDNDLTITEAKPKFSLSPRLGISHPITATSKLFFNYGHFKQLPTYEQMFMMARGGSGELQQIGDPDIELEKTIMYELGYDQSIADAYLLQIAAYYRDISNQRDATSYISADGSVNYTKITSRLYRDVRGFEVTARRSRGRWWTGFVNYTYHVVTQGHFGRGEIYQDPSSQREYDRNTRVLYQERPIPQPFARASLTFYTPKKFGPEILGSHVLADWKLNIIGDWRAGAWLTWNPHRKVNVAANVKAKDFHNVRLRLSKTFDFESLDLTFMLDVNNLFNSRHLNLYSFYDSHDFDNYFQSLHLSGSTDYDNIDGHDRIGDYRKEGVDFQPIERVGDIDAVSLSSISDRAIYYETGSKNYYEYVDGGWQQVEQGRINEILENKAYIDMPNHTYFNFLNPRSVFIGVRTSFKL